MFVLYMYVWWRTCYNRDQRGGCPVAYSEAAYKAAKKYREKNIKRVPLDMQITDYENVKAFAAAHGESVNGFIKRAIQETMERDNAAPGDGPA